MSFIGYDANFLNFQVYFAFTRKRKELKEELEGVEAEISRLRPEFLAARGKENGSSAPPAVDAAKPKNRGKRRQGLQLDEQLTQKLKTKSSAEEPGSDDSKAVGDVNEEQDAASNSSDLSSTSSMDTDGGPHCGDPEAEVTSEGEGDHQQSGAGASGPQAPGTDVPDQVLAAGGPSAVGEGSGLEGLSAEPKLQAPGGGIAASGDDAGPGPMDEDVAGRAGAAVEAAGVANGAAEGLAPENGAVEIATVAGQGLPGPPLPLPPPPPAAPKVIRPADGRPALSEAVQRTRLKDKFDTWHVRIREIIQLKQLLLPQLHAAAFQNPASKLIC